MAGARVERIGTVFTRTRALLETGSMKPEDKPLWFDVYKAFPPKVEPTYFRPVDPRPPIDIVYHEDHTRALFYKVHGGRHITNLNSEKPTFLTKFMNEYTDVQSKHPDLSPDEILKIVDQNLNPGDKELQSDHEEQDELETAIDELEKSKQQQDKEVEYLQRDVEHGEHSSASVHMGKDELTEQLGHTSNLQIQDKEDVEDKGKDWWENHEKTPKVDIDLTKNDNK